MTPSTRIVGQSGRRYLIERLLQDKPGHPLGKVYLASVNGCQYVIKSVSRRDFEYHQDMYNDLQSCSHIRVADDSFPDQSMFAYKHLKEHYLSFAQRNAPLVLTKRILRDSLKGIAFMHQKNIVHTDIKPDNIMIDWEETEDGVIVQEVKLADIEDAAYLKSNQSLVGRQLGNWMWRSPEAHASARVKKPSDIFSFGVVCIYALTKTVIFSVNAEILGKDVDKLAIALERQLSYFADPDSLRGLLEYLQDSPWVQKYLDIADRFGKENPRKPISMWKGVDEDFKDLVGNMTNIDPMRRITADEALDHPWFVDVESGDTE